MEEIIIDFEKDGTSRVEGKNIQGPDCTKLTKAIEDALGAVGSRVLKPDYRSSKVAAKTARR